MSQPKKPPAKWNDKLPHVSSVSICPYIRDIQHITIKGHKYFRVAHQFSENEDVSPALISRFFKKLKRAKTLKTLKLGLEPSHIRLKPQMVKSVFKFSSQKIRELNISNLPFGVFSSRQKNFVLQLKRLQRIYMAGDQTQIKSLYGIKSLQHIFIDIQNQEETPASELFKTLVCLDKLKSLYVLVFPDLLNEIMSVLNKFSLTYKRPVRFQIATKDQQIQDELPHLSTIMTQKINKLSLQHVKASSVLNHLLTRQKFPLPNLQNLKLGFTAPESALVSYLQYLKKITSLKKLSLYFNECWSIKFVEDLIASLRFPTSLESLKISMPLALKSLITKVKIQKAQDTMNTLPWRKDNIFEEEKAFASLFQTIKEVDNLKKLDMNFQMLESFNSHYTNFFVSILNRSPNLSSFDLQIADSTLLHVTNDQPEPFDLSIFFESCSRISNLEHIQVLVPNIMFEDAKIYPTMTNLKSFNIGVVEFDEERFLTFQNISKQVKEWLKALLIIAPKLNSLILDFTEEIDEKSFSDRFALIQAFKHLQFFCSRFILGKCSSNVAKNAGRALQSLTRLSTAVIRFEESDRNILEIMKYMKYHRSLKEVLVSFNKAHWIGNGCVINTLQVDGQNEEMDNSTEGSSTTNIS